MRLHLSVPLLVIAIAIAGCAGLTGGDRGAPPTAVPVPTYAIVPAGPSPAAGALVLEVPAAWALPVYTNRTAGEGCTLLVVEANFTVRANGTDARMGQQRFAVVDGDQNRYPVHIENRRDYAVPPLVIESGFYASLLYVMSTASPEAGPATVDGRLISFVRADARPPFRLEYLEGRPEGGPNGTPARLAWYTVASAPVPDPADGLATGEREDGTSRSEDFGKVSATVRNATFVDLPAGYGQAAGALLNEWNVTGIAERGGNYPSGVVRYLNLDLAVESRPAGAYNLSFLTGEDTREPLVLTDETGFFSYRPLQASLLADAASTATVGGAVRLNATYLVFDVPGMAYTFEVRDVSAEDGTETLLANAPVAIRP